MSKLDDVKVTEPDSIRYMTLGVDPDAKRDIKDIFVEIIRSTTMPADIRTELRKKVEEL